jgi:hypothetical protein
MHERPRLGEPLLQSTTTSIESIGPPSVEKSKLKGKAYRKPLRIYDKTQATKHLLLLPEEVEYIQRKGQASKIELKEYNIFGGLDELVEFGIGISLYFNTLMILSAICTICGAIYIPAMIWYNRHTQSPRSIPIVGESAAGIDISIPIGWTLPDVIVCILLVFFAMIGKYYQEKMTEKIDLAQQTAQDYSVKVENPPKDADDALEWFDFFKEYGDVVNITICKNNGDLLLAIGQAKLIEQELQSMQEEGVLDGDIWRKRDSLRFVVKRLLQQFGMLRDKTYWEDLQV